MNVLISINKENILQYFIAIVSILENNENVSFICINNNLTEDDIKDLKTIIGSYKSDIEIYNDIFDEKYGYNLISFFNNIFYKYGNTKVVDRIMFIAPDIIVNSNICEFYSQDFEGKSIIVREQSSVYKEHHRHGARPENGQYFDIRAIIFNVDQLKTINLTDLTAKVNQEYGNTISEQAILNCLFKDDCKYDENIENNIRFSIISEAEKNGKNVEIIEKKIIGFEKRDILGCGMVCMPWEVAIDEYSFGRLCKQSEDVRPYDTRKSRDIFIDAYKIWVNYAKIASKYVSSLKEKITNQNKIENILVKTDPKEFVTIRKTVLSKITECKEIGEDLLRKTTYGDLIKYTDTLDPQIAKQTMLNLFEQTTKKNKRIPLKVGFIVYSSSEWQCEELYKKLKEDPDFDPYIIVNYQLYGEEKIIEEIYKQTLKLFDDRYQVISLFNNSIDMSKEIDDMDILVYASPFEMMPEYINVAKRKINQLIVHVPYGIYIEDKDDVRYGETFYDTIFFKALWKFYVASEIDIGYVSHRQRTSGMSVVYSGFPKIDEYLERSYKTRNLWKLNDNTKLKVIWAPHFNMKKGMNGTFSLNGKWLFEFAREHTEISWIVKPHPRFAVGAIESGVFDNLDQVEAYWEAWDNLINARVVRQGPYYDIFASSDAMILDSLSFLVEYQYTRKPLLFLLSEEQRGLGGLGTEIYNIVYKERGDNHGGILKFVLDCMTGIDEKKEIREIFFIKHLDYTNKNGTNATNFIYGEFKDICR